MFFRRQFAIFVYCAIIQLTLFYLIMFTPSDLEQLKQKGISTTQVEKQLTSFVQGFPYLHIKRASAIGDGLLQLSKAEIEMAIETWENYMHENHQIEKFVPASGAASRMFKDLFEFLNGEQEIPTTPFEKQFFDNIERFAFFADLNEVCVRNEDLTINELLKMGRYKDVVANLLDKKGLNYGKLPKGLLKFHRYPQENRTPFLEHLVEGALYASSNGQSSIHFTVSTEHRALFEAHLKESLEAYEEKFGTKFHVTFSEQKPSTDTIAADANNQPFRTDDGKLLFRPGGHGALIENLNDLDADIVFIKNIDNVVPDRLKEPTIEFKKVIAGLLVTLQQQTFAYLKELENPSISDAKLLVIAQFCAKRLNNHNPDQSKLSREELISYLHNKLNRPIRVCGMVKNEGEPGGGPFLTENTDGTVSPQILESSQIKDKALMAQATHFNPVDLVCTLKNYRGKKFNLPDYVDAKTGFISSKSSGGKELKALELPGLWNGAMSDWNTIFVEVPIETFNPVKTVNDLLREQHQ